MKSWYSQVLEQGDAALRAQVARALLKERKPRKPRKPDHFGRIVEFLRRGHHCCGVVQVAPGKGRSLWILNQEGKEAWVSHRKLIDMSSEKIGLRPRHEIVRALRQVNRRRERIKRELNLRPLWELAAEEPDRKWTLKELAELYFGEDPDSDRLTALARLLGEGKFFSRQEQHYLPLPAGKVEERGRATEQRHRDRDRLEEAALWLRQVADGKEGARPEGAAEAMALLEQAALFEGESPRAKEAARLMKQAHLHGPLAAFDVLVKLGHWDVNENLELLRCEVPVDFSAKTLAEAVELRGLPAAGLGRRWWGRRVYGFSRDGKVCDRAFSVRRTLFGYKLGLHFAAPALLVQPEGRVEEEAMERGASIYLPDGSIPMLPPSLAAAAGLTPGERRPALTVEVRLDLRRQIKGFALRLCRVRPRKVLRMEEAEARLAANPYLRWLYDLARTRRQTRRQRGDLILAAPELNMDFREGAVRIQRLEANQAGPLICEELKLLAQELAGAFCARNGIPSVYRVEPVSPGISVEGEEYDAAQVHAGKKQMSRGRLQTEPPAHGPRRVCIGQPLDGYEDLLMQRQLLGYIADGTHRYSREDLARGLSATTLARDAAAKVMGSARHYWQLKYLEEKAGEEVEGVVVERAGVGILVELDCCLLKVFVPGRRETWAAPGDRIRAMVGLVSARRDLIRLEHPRPLQAGAKDYSSVSL